MNAPSLASGPPRAPEALRYRTERRIALSAEPAIPPSSRAAPRHLAAILERLAKGADRTDRAEAAVLLRAVARLLVPPPGGNRLAPA